MNPIKVLLVHRDDWYRGKPRIDGFFQYPVPEFKVTHLPVNKGFHLDLHDYRSHDIVFWDDGKYKSYAGFKPNPPHSTYMVPQVCQYVLYPTLTRSHYNTRVARARRNADLVLIDHDDIERWGQDTNLPCVRMAYCTDEYYYSNHGQPRDIDVGFYYITAWNKERPALDSFLSHYCAQRHWTYHSTHGESVGTAYADLLARTKVTIHLLRTPFTRPPRIFDASASGSAVLSNPMPEVSGEKWINGDNYLSFSWPRSEEYKQFTPDEIPTYSEKDCYQIIDALDYLIQKDGWSYIANNAYQYVLAHHTWKIRAKQLYSTILNHFPKIAHKVERR